MTAANLPAGQGAAEAAVECCAALARSGGRAARAEAVGAVSAAYGRPARLTVRELGGLFDLVLPEHRVKLFGETPKVVWQVAVVVDRMNNLPSVEEACCLMLVRQRYQDWLRLASGGLSASERREGIVEWSAACGAGAGRAEHAPGRGIDPRAVAAHTHVDMRELRPPGLPDESDNVACGDARVRRYAHTSLTQVAELDLIAVVAANDDPIAAVLAGERRLVRGPR
jgi:hypothetical protein